MFVYVISRILVFPSSKYHDQIIYINKRHILIWTQSVKESNFNNHQQQQKQEPAHHIPILKNRQHWTNNLSWFLSWLSHLFLTMFKYKALLLAGKGIPNYARLHRGGIHSKRRGVLTYPCPFVFCAVLSISKQNTSKPMYIHGIKPRPCNSSHWALRLSLSSLQLAQGA